MNRRQMFISAAAAAIAPALPPLPQPTQEEIMRRAIQRVAKIVCAWEREHGPLNRDDDFARAA